MSEWYAYDWTLSGQPARFFVDLSYVDEFDALGDFITTLAWNGRAFAPTTQTVGILGYSKFPEKNF